MTEPFKTAIIDPPWPYDRSSNHKGLSGYADKQYNPMSIKDLMTLRVKELVSKYIFMWTAGPFLPDGLALLDAWDFDYKTQLVWHKTPGLGVGYWFRGDHEMVLVAKKKNVASIRTNERSLFKNEEPSLFDEPSLFAAKRLGHSEKPDYIHKLIEKHFPGPYLELFGRKGRDGWTILGNEAPGDGRDIRESIDLLLPPKGVY
jgi:N6-adenosine-specific RNA methylase IME4